MRKGLLKIGSWIVLRLLALRYRIEVKGLESIQGKKGVLFLPNHPAEIDPIIVYNLLARRFRPRPLVIAHFYYLRGARFFMELIRAIPVPNFELSANSWKVRQIEKCLEKVREEIQKGENFLIYPSGHLKREGHESIGGNSFVQKLLEACPETKVVLVRSSGLWGSSFSCAFSEESPDFWESLTRGIRVIFKNGIFFVPKRKVTIELEEVGVDFPKQGTRLEINQALEKWYNRYVNDQGEVVTSEPLRLISYSAYRHEVPLVTKEEKKSEKKVALDVPETIREEIYRELKKLSKASEIKEEMDLSRDLGLDSLDLASIHAFMDQKFDVETTSPGQLKTVYDLLKLVVEGSVSKPKLDTENLKHYEWPEEEFRRKVKAPEGRTIPEAFLHVCDRMGKAMACGDALTKIMSYREVKIGVMVLARRFREFPEKYVAILLPSTMACYIVILALQFAGKIPVMLNWTGGERNLQYAKDLLGLKRILSSRRFLERAEVLELGALEEDLLLLEDFRQGVSLWNKLSGGLLVRKGAAALAKKFSLDRLQEEDPAVILFTSGTENYPKAVPLSHKNILSNQRSAMECVDLHKEDILYGALPPFHSFGFSVTGLFPILAGLRVFFAPDPTDSHGIARDCFYRKITLICLAPSFYRNLFRVASPRQLKSLRLFVAGAEKAPPELFEHVKRLGGNKEMIEGYGITECSPIVTINRQGEAAQGVGKPLPGIELCVIHPETEERIAEDQQGEVCIRGPSVFSGYLGKEASNPFIEIEGKEWYRSGDIGHLSPDGALILGGRLKRFVKIGGEMVSLSAIEEALATFSRKEELIKPEAETPQLVIGVEEGERPTLILFTTFEMDVETANRVLKEEGFARIVKVAASYRIDEIPMTGTGKVELRRIRELVKEKHA